MDDSTRPPLPIPRAWSLADRGALVTALAVVLYGALGTDRMLDVDGHFHIACARWMLEHRTVWGLPWMSQSVFEEIGWVDHQLAYHLLLIPFTPLGVVGGAHASSAVLAGLFVLALAGYLRSAGIRIPGLVALAVLGCSAPFFFNLLLPRPTALSLSLMLLTLWLYQRRHLRGCAAAAFAFAWTYHLSLVVVPLCLLLGGADALFGRRDGLRPLLILAGGLLLGFALNPYTPHTFEFLYLHVIYKVLNPDDLPVGREWMATTVAAFWGENWRAWIAVGGALVLALIHRRRISARTLGHLAIAAVWLWAAARSYKFIQYLIPFAMIAATLTARDAVRGSSGWAGRLGRVVVRSRIVPAALLVALAGVALAVAVEHTRRMDTRRPDPERYRPGMEALCSHAEPGDVVVHTHWGIFAELTAWCGDVRYMSGLDPSFMYLTHRETYDLLERAQRGEIADLSGHVLDPLGARWLVAVPAQAALVEQALADPGLEMAYSDPAIVIFTR